MTVGEMVKRYIIPFALGGVFLYIGERVISPSNSVRNYELKETKGNVFLIDKQTQRKELVKELFEVYDLFAFQIQEYNNIQDKYKQLKKLNNIETKLDD
ncbi:MAG: hypothetical protein QXG00_05615 [Candidatus Woesearchaeota archaeon]